MNAICKECGQPLTVENYKCANCGAKLDPDIFYITTYVHMMEDGVNPDTATDEEIEKWLDENVGK